MSRNFNFTSEGERVVAVRVEQTVEAGEPILIHTQTGQREVATGDTHDVYVGDRLIGNIYHGYSDVEVGSMLILRENWTATSSEYSRGSIGNIASEMDAIRALVGLSGVLS